MDQESYEQVELDEDLVGDSAKFLKENTVCEVQVFDEKPLGIELPAAIDLEITETTPQPKGDGDQPAEGSRRRDGSTCPRAFVYRAGHRGSHQYGNRGVSRQGLRCSRCEKSENCWPRVV